MKPYWTDGKATLYHGDCLEVLRRLPSGSVHCCCTSPPYFQLRNYGVDGQIGLEETPAEYVAKLVEVFREVRRVLRDDGVAWINLGDSYSSQGGGGAAPGKTAIVGNTINGAVGDRAPRIPPVGLKPKDLCMIPARVALALQDDGWWLRSAAPWVKRCLSGGTWLYVRSQKGDMPMMLKDLVRLNPETVQLWNGERWTQVVGFHKTLPSPDRRRENSRRKSAAFRGGERQFGNELEIELRSGERIGCTADHVWPTDRGNVRADELRCGDVIKRCRLPEPSSVSNPESLDDEEIGWFVGLFLAEGHAAERIIHISGHKNESEPRLARLAPLAERYHGKAAIKNAPGNSGRITISGPVLFGILKTYLYGDNAKTKCLTPKCWQRSDKFLRSLLMGYLEGDGSYDAKNDRWRLGFCNNDNLARDLRAIGARLGVSVRIKRGVAIEPNTGKRFKTWRGSVRLDPQNVQQFSGGFQRRNDGEVIATRAGRSRVYWDIEVADDPHLFALASGTLTHNSAMPESVEDRPSTALEYIFLLTKSPRYFYDADAVRINGVEPERKRNDRIGGKNGHTVRHSPGGMMEGSSTRNRRNSDWWFESVGMLLNEEGDPLGFDVTTQPYPGAHFATFPPKLIEPCILAGTSAEGACSECGAPWVRVVEKEGQVRRQAIVGASERRDRDRPNGQDLARRQPPKTTGWRPTCDCNAAVVPCVVLDPFNGSGTTAYVARQNGCRAIGIELSEEYCRLTVERLRQGVLL